MAKLIFTFNEGRRRSKMELERFEEEERKLDAKKNFQDKIFNLEVKLVIFHPT